LAPDRPGSATAGWLLTAAVALCSIVDLTLPRTDATELWIVILSLFLAGGGIFVYGVTLAPRRVGQLRLTLTEPAFVLGHSRPYLVRWAVGALAWIAFANGFTRLEDTPWRTVRVALTVLLAIQIAAPCLAFLFGRPRLELRPHSLRVLGQFSRYDVPWDAIASAMPPNPNTWRARRDARLTIDKPDLVSSTGLSRHHRREISLPLAVIYPPADVAALIDHYVTHPGDRDAIGAADELRRLRDTGLA
jgi:hypothetical protein